MVTITWIISYLGRSPSPNECQEALPIVLATGAETGFPVVPDKVESPSTFLGTQIDMLEREVRLPPGKIHRIHHELRDWTRRQLLSLIGILQHASTVIPPGRPFLRYMIDLSNVATQLHHHIRLNHGFWSDLQWWIAFMGQWNGRCFFPVAQRQIIVYSDASGAWGCGAFSGPNWFQLEWPENIASKDLTPILLAVLLWGKTTQVTCFCDYAAVVAAINKGSARDPPLM